MRQKPTACRRSHPRFSIATDLFGRLEFGYPASDGAQCVMVLRDLSQCGISFLLRHELPGLEPGESINDVRVTVGKYEIRGDLLVMHLTPDASSGSVCGALFYPAEDGDILALRSLLAELESRAADAQAASVPA